MIGSGVYIDTVNAAIWKRAMGFGAVALALGAALLVVGTLISRNLLRQLGGEPDYARHIARSIAQGDLAVAVKTRPGDESSLMLDIQSMRDSLHRIVQRVRSGCAAAPSTSPAPRNRSRRATATCRAAPNPKPVRWSKRLRRWRK